MRLHATFPGLTVPPKMHFLTTDDLTPTEVTLKTECGSQTRVVPVPWNTVDPAVESRLRNAAAIARDTDHPVTHLIQSADHAGQILYACPVRQRRGRASCGVLVGSIAAPAEQASLLVRQMLTPPAQ